MNKGILILVIGAISLFCIIYFTNPVYSEGNTFKVFKDGLTYSEGCDGKPDVWHRSCNILFEDKWYKCNPTSAGGSQAWLNPVCVEIIMRSLP